MLHSDLSSPSLPVELWLQIFHWAILDPWTHALHAIDYHPFKAGFMNVGPVEAHYTRRALPSVCKQWRQWATPLLYEDIVIAHEDHSLGQMLQHGHVWEDGSSIPPCARLVRRAHLPYTSTITVSSEPLPALEILELCSSLQVLVRTAVVGLAMAYQFSTKCPPLLSLKRVDWWHHNEAARTGGINSLPDVLGLAPNVQYLSVGGEMWVSYLNTPLVHLPHLTTLRMRRVNAFFVLQVCRWTLPALRNVILDHIVHAEIFWPFWTTFGTQIRTVELGISLKFYVQDFLSHVLAACPQLEELNYYAHFTHPPPVDRAMEYLKTVGLHSHPNSFFRVGSSEYWTHLGRHFQALSQPVFSTLKRVMLYGDWNAVIGDEEFNRIAQPLRDKGCVV